VNKKREIPWEELEAWFLKENRAPRAPPRKYASKQDRKEAEERRVKQDYEEIK
jgi:hypothetical protein